MKTKIRQLVSLLLMSFVLMASGTTVFAAEVTGVESAQVASGSAITVSTESAVLEEDVTGTVFTFNEAGEPEYLNISVPDDGSGVSIFAGEVLGWYKS